MPGRDHHLAAVRAAPGLPLGLPSASPRGSASRGRSRRTACRTPNSSGIQTRGPGTVCGTPHNLPADQDRRRGKRRQFKPKPRSSKLIQGKPQDAPPRKLHVPHRTQPLQPPWAILRLEGAAEGLPPLPPPPPGGPGGHGEKVLLASLSKQLESRDAPEHGDRDPPTTAAPLAHVGGAPKSGR